MPVSVQIAAASLSLRARIVPTGQRLPWVEARKAVADKGGLPSNVLHDDVLVKLWPTLSEPEKAKLRGYYSAWAREVLVYPTKKGQFERGKDVVDTHKDKHGREWVFPASSVPGEAVGKDKVGLFVDPQNVEVNSKRVVVLAEPKSISILTPFIQTHDGMGLVDEKTRVPLEAAPEVAERLADDSMRWLCRLNGAGVKPLVRGVVDIYRHNVLAYDGHDVAFGVSFVAYDTLDGTKTLAEGVSLADIRRLAQGASGSDLPEALRALGSEQLEAVRRLAQLQLAA